VCVGHASQYYVCQTFSAFAWPRVASAGLDMLKKSMTQTGDFQADTSLVFGLAQESRVSLFLHRKNDRLRRRRRRRPNKFSTFC
jgi:hypothetical protein